MQDSRTPALVNVGAAAVNVGAALLYTGALGLGLRGMALAHATSYVVAAVASLLLLRRRLRALDERAVGRTTAKALAAGALSSAAAFGVVRLWEIAAGERSLLLHGARVGVAILGGMLVFAGAALILRVGVVDDLRRSLLWRVRG